MDAMLPEYLKYSHPTRISQSLWQKQVLFGCKWKLTRCKYSSMVEPSRDIVTERTQPRKKYGSRAIGKPWPSFADYYWLSRSKLRKQILKRMQQITSPEETLLRTRANCNMKVLSNLLKSDLLTFVFYLRLHSDKPLQTIVSLLK